MKKLKKKKKKGFTLIELLAVILILGIIALIAIPQVTDVISEAKESSTKRSAEQYISAVEQVVTLEEMKGNTITGTHSVDDLKDIVEIKGILPDNGIVTIENNEIISCNLQYGEYTITCYDASLEIIKKEIKKLTKEMFEDEDTSWEDIISSVKAGKYDNRSTSELIGAERKLLLAAHTNDCVSGSGTGDDYKCTPKETGEQSLTVRIVNVTDCLESLESNTACGFVLEFASVIEYHNMNPANNLYILGYNVGSWPNTVMRTYLNSTILNALPIEVKYNIINTKVVSGYGNEDTANFTSTDKLYLLSPIEILNQKNSQDPEKDTTRQLDYYAKMGVTTSNYSLAEKQYGSARAVYWLRTPSTKNNTAFLDINHDGSLNSNSAHDTRGIAPAFRLK